VLIEDWIRVGQEGRLDDEASADSFGEVAAKTMCRPQRPQATDGLSTRSVRCELR
jgi:hypothetical protein